MLIYVVAWTTKYIFKNKHVWSDLIDKKESPLFAFWHGRQFYGYYILRHSRLVVPASLSKDGEIVTSVLGGMGHRIVRGSSSKRAIGMLLEMIREVRKGQGMGLSVDGPTGPYRVVKMGIIKVAQKTGYPIVPMTCSSKRRWIFRKSWDNYMLPKPFTTVIVKFMAPIYVPKNVTKKELEQYRTKLQKSLEQGYNEVDADCGNPGLEEQLMKEKRSLKKPMK